MTSPSWLAKNIDFGILRRLKKKSKENQSLRKCTGNYILAATHAEALHLIERGVSIISGNGFDDGPNINLLVRRIRLHEQAVVLKGSLC